MAIRLVPKSDLSLRDRFSTTQIVAALAITAVLLAFSRWAIIRATDATDNPFVVASIAVAIFICGLIGWLFYASKFSLPKTSSSTPAITAIVLFTLTAATWSFVTSAMQKRAFETFAADAQRLEEAVRQRAFFALREMRRISTDLETIDPTEIEQYFNRQAHQIYLIFKRMRGLSIVDENGSALHAYPSEHKALDGTLSLWVESPFGHEKPTFRVGQKMLAGTVIPFKDVTGRRLNLVGDFIDTFNGLNPRESEVAFDVRDHDQPVDTVNPLLTEFGQSFELVQAGFHLVLRVWPTSPIPRYGNAQTTLALILGLIFASIVPVILHLLQKNRYRLRVVDNLNAYLGSANEGLAAFSRIASHDLRAPLRYVTAHAEFLLEDAKDSLDENAVAHINAISAAATRMDAQINALLTFCRLGSAGIEKTACSGQTIIENIVAVLPESTRQLILISQIPTLYADPVLLQSVLENLVQNAIKYADASTRGLEIEAQSREFDVLLSFRDYGHGVEPSQLDTIFEPGVRGVSNSTESGFGFGLANCRKIIEGHGGRIWMESALGQGSTVFITLPHRDFDQKMKAA